MKLKKIFHAASFFILMTVALPAASTEIVPVAPSKSANEMTEDPRARKLIQRLEEIRDINREALTKHERKSLRREVRDIKKEMKETKRGVYLSVGAIIIIILLLILIL